MQIKNWTVCHQCHTLGKANKRCGLIRYSPEENKSNQKFSEQIWEENQKDLVKVSLRKDDQGEALWVFKSKKDFSQGRKALSVLLAQNTEVKNSNWLKLH